MSYNLDLTIVFERDDDGSVLARCIELGTASCGATREEALGNVQEAIDEHVAALTEEGLLESTLTDRGYGGLLYGPENVSHPITSVQNGGNSLGAPSRYMVAV